MTTHFNGPAGGMVRVIPMRTGARPALNADPLRGSSMMKALCIQSYFSLPTDLAAEMRDWPEFVRGSGYDVELRWPATGESVTVRYVHDNDRTYIAITSESPSEGSGSLFDRVAGRVIYALSAHTDHLLVDRHVPPA